jgi:hypothetical protein
MKNNNNNNKERDIEHRAWCEKNNKQLSLLHYSVFYISRSTVAKKGIA